MSRRKHVTMGLQQEVEPPTESQRIVQIVSPRGGNLVEVSYPNGAPTMVLLPNKFNKKLWLKRGGYVIIEEGLQAAGTQLEQDAAGPQHGSITGSKVTGTIVAVLYDDHVRQLKKLGAWPEEYLTRDAQPQLQQQEARADPGGDGMMEEDKAGSSDTGDGSGEDDSGLPALHRNTNRKIIVHYVSEDEDDEDGDGSQEGNTT